jgi:ATP-dependent Lon protease
MLLPRMNEKDIAELPEDVRAALTFVPVESMDQVLELALERKIEPRAAAPPVATPAAKSTEGPTEYAH